MSSHWTESPCWHRGLGCDRDKACASARDRGPAPARARGYVGNRRLHVCRVTFHRLVEEAGDRRRRHRPRARRPGLVPDRDGGTDTDPAPTRTASPGTALVASSEGTRPVQLRAAFPTAATLALRHALPLLPRRPSCGNQPLTNPRISVLPRVDNDTLTNQRRRSNEAPPRLAVGADRVVDSLRSGPQSLCCAGTMGCLPERGGGCSGWLIRGDR